MSAPEYKQLPHDDDFGKFESPWEGFNKSQKQEPEFKVYLVRHCQSCANVASGIPDQKSGYTKKFWRQPLCTSVGIIQAIAAGIVLKEILPEGWRHVEHLLLQRPHTMAEMDFNHRQVYP